MFFPDFLSVRFFAEKLNSVWKYSSSPNKIAQAGELFAIELITEIYFYLIAKYERKISRKSFSEALAFLKNKFPEFGLKNLLENFSRQYAIRENASAEILREMLINRIDNINPAFGKYREIFNDEALEENRIYPKIIAALNEFFETQPKIKNLNLVKLLLKPIEASPNSIEGQLDYIRTHWKDLLDEKFFALLQSLDLLKEERKLGLSGAGESKIYSFDEEEEYEKFSQDKDWMPNLVMIAKNTYVWLYQLGKKYDKEISRLDEIPEEEIRTLAERGFGGLWFIGLWERSPASRRIKHLSGNSDAIASAYSLKNYRIATALGGEEALEKLKRTASKYSLRIACDMVPNHTGIDSDRLLNHPEWFLQLDYAPFPNYSFSGENLSPDPNFVIQIEDRYYDKTDAAVVFKFYDRQKNQTRFIYHGNDGTSFPWNDTAQLNYLMPEVREAVSDEIIKIAKEFPIIRFDAAMTLAKKHYQRLWFPQPGSGGDIPTRAEFGMTKEEFNKYFPKEFWREVVDRAAIEAPNTLLLAEAFWMMEGYFVRTLGMHRVYNSAFMNMLKNEENAKYRQSIFNVIGFNPQILKRFVNFMSNPDEETAVAQFGKDDKYFGVCILMVTMPGLPMFAHGQIEGFTERYGMEYSRPKQEEKEDSTLIERHRKEIFPLMKKRYLFSDAEKFLLYDFVTDTGFLNENVFAYSNEKNGEFSLVVFHNKFEFTSGWLHYASYSESDVNGKRSWRRKTLGDALHLHNEQNFFVIFRDFISGMQFIRNSAEIHQKGLHQEMEAFKYRVFLDFYEVEDNERKNYEKLAKYLQGGGTNDIERVLKKVNLLPIISTFSEIISPENLKKMKVLRKIRTKEYEIFLFEYLKKDIFKFIVEVSRHLQSSVEPAEISDRIVSELDSLLDDNLPEIAFKKRSDADYFIIVFIILRYLGKFISEENYEKAGAKLIDKLMLKDELETSFEKVTTTFATDNLTNLFKLAIKYQFLWKEIGKTPLEKTLRKMFNDADIQSYLKFNEFDNKLWFNKEAFAECCEVLKIVNLVSVSMSETDSETKSAAFQDLKDFFRKMKLAEKRSGYEVKKFLDYFTGKSRTVKPHK